MTAPKKTDAIATTNIKHNGKLYTKGDTISLTEDEHAQLVKLKAVKQPEIAPESEPVKPAKNAPKKTTTRTKSTPKQTADKSESESETTSETPNESESDDKGENE